MGGVRHRFGPLAPWRTHGVAAHQAHSCITSLLLPNRQLPPDASSPDLLTPIPQLLLLPIPSSPTQAAECERERPSRRSASRRRPRVLPSKSHRLRPLESGLRPRLSLPLPRRAQHLLRPPWLSLPQRRTVPPAALPSRLPVFLPTPTASPDSRRRIPPPPGTRQSRISVRWREIFHKRHLKNFSNSW